MLPDISDIGKMAYVGRMTILRKARSQAGKELRDKLIPMLNNLEGLHSDGWNVDGVVVIVERINELTKAIQELN